MGHPHGYRAWLCSATSPARALSRDTQTSQTSSQALESLLFIFLLLGWQEQRTITAFLVQLTNCMLAQFSLSTISQSKLNQNSQTGLCFLEFINPVCLFHLYRLLLLYHVLNQRKEHEFWFCFLVVLVVFFSSSKVSALQGYKYLISEWKFHWLTKCN